MTESPSAAAASPATVSPGRRRWLLLLLLAFVAGWPLHRHVLDNETTRYLMVAAVVDDGALRIDPYISLTGDLSRDPATGRYFGNKAIGAPLLGVGAYWVWRRLGGGPLLEPSPLAGDLTARDASGKPIGPTHVLRLWPRWWVKLWGAALPFAALGWGLHWLARRWGADERGAMLAALGYGLATIGLHHGMLFSGHGLAAAGCFLGWCAWERAQATATAGGVLWAAAGGLLVGLGALADATAMYLALCLTGYVLLTRARWTRVLGWIGGGAIMAAVMLAYNAACFGSPWAMPMAAAYQVHATYQAGAAQGLHGIGLPSPDTAWRLLFSASRGLLATSPLLLLAGWGWLRRWRQGERLQAGLATVVVVGYWLLISGFYGWHGGWTYGPRYLVPVLPFLALGLAWVPRDRLFLPALGLIAVAQVWLVALSTPLIPPVVRNPVREFAAPFLGYGIGVESPATWLGMPWPLHILAYTLVCATAAAWLWRRSADPTAIPHTGSPAAPPPRLLQALAAALILAIALSVSYLRTPGAWVHLARAGWTQSYLMRYPDPQIQSVYQAEREHAMRLQTPAPSPPAHAP